MVKFNYWKIYSFLGLGLIFFYLILETYLLIHKNFLGDLPVLLHAAYAIRNGYDPYQFTHGYFIYPPLQAFIFIPLTFLKLKIACLLWTVINFLLIFFILMLNFRIIATHFKFQCSRWQATAACSLALLMCYHELWWEIKWTQYDLMILAGFTLGLYWLDRRPYTSGIILGLIANIKYQPIVFIPYFLLRARFKIIVAIVVGITLGMLLPVAKLGWAKNLAYLKKASSGFIHMPGESLLNTYYPVKVPQITWSGNITITSGLTRVFLDHGWSQNRALITVFLIAVLTFLLLWRLFKKFAIPFMWRKPGLFCSSKEPAVVTLEYFLIMIGMLIFSPQGTMRHFILLLGAHLLAIMLLLFPRNNVKRWPLLLGVLCYQAGKLYDDLIAHPLHWPWSYFGGPAWCLLIFMPLLVITSLSYLRDLFQEQSVVDVSQPFSLREHGFLVSIPDSSKAGTQ
ncbi:MAG: DUF2029 domain-containing protein [Proteobacteria bacterium]|nr:DUF2029 domain-containing protein [Pseudomonadota bacterium]